MPQFDPTRASASDCSGAIQSRLCTFLGVGGGDGKYIVHGSEGGERFPTLSHPTSTDERLVPLCVGGQLAEYPARWIVDLERTLAAAKMFYEAGTFDCG